MPARFFRLPLLIGLAPEWARFVMRFTESCRSGILNSTALQFGVGYSTRRTLGGH
jgi:hypothetical protein